MAHIIKRDWKTIPNCMSYFRIVLIPVFVILYVNGWYRSAAVVIVISWFSDVADGFVARRFNMTSELGKVLDPVADK
ncbi:MAG: CDP-alcohol phosphatidyltransferase family protein, partial [Oscillospiraceae bacterium]|nr:CDP-alcohol phosphatidyltransferase family protein [Oscillospiraceae bacterium]